MEDQLEPCENCGELHLMNEMAFDAEDGFYICMECIEAKKEFENEDTI